MKCETPSQAVLVSLPISIIEALLTMRSVLDGDVASALGKSIGGAPLSNTPMLDRPSPHVAIIKHGKYAAEFLGVGFSVNTLAAVFGRVVDIMADVAPEVLVSLAAIRTRGRRFVSLVPRGIHPHSPHLPVLQTASGWWISNNISQDQLKQALRSLCDVSGLNFGKDLKFPVRWTLLQRWSGHAPFYVAFLRTTQRTLPLCPPSWLA
jgi:hypothetical protein